MEAGVREQARRAKETGRVGMKNGDNGRPKRGGRRGERGGEVIIKKGGMREVGKRD